MERVHQQHPRPTLRAWLGRRLQTWAQRLLEPEVSGAAADPSRAAQRDRGGPAPDAPAELSEGLRDWIARVQRGGAAGLLDVPGQAAPEPSTSDPETVQWYVSERGERHEVPRVARADDEAIARVERGPADDVARVGGPRVLASSRSGGRARTPLPMTDAAPRPGGADPRLHADASLPVKGRVEPAAGAAPGPVLIGATRAVEPEDPNMWRRVRPMEPRPRARSAASAAIEVGERATPTPRIPARGEAGRSASGEPDAPGAPRHTPAVPARAGRPQHPEGLALTVSTRAARAHVGDLAQRGRPISTEASAPTRERGAASWLRVAGCAQRSAPIVRQPFEERAVEMRPAAGELRELLREERRGELAHHGDLRAGHALPGDPGGDPRAVMDREATPASRSGSVLHGARSAWPWGDEEGRSPRRAIPEARAVAWPERSLWPDLIDEDPWGRIDDAREDRSVHTRRWLESEQRGEEAEWTGSRF